MRFLTTLAFIVCLTGSGMNANVAMGWWSPFSGYWGAGYAPYYGGYYGAYRPYYGGYYRAAYYGAGYYGCSSCSCSPCGCSPCDSCCSSPCGTGCGVGCASGCGSACGAVSSEKAVDPSRDPISNEGNGRSRGDYEGWHGNSGSEDETGTESEDPLGSPFSPEDRTAPSNSEDPDSLRERFRNRGLGDDGLGNGLEGSLDGDGADDGPLFGDEDVFGREANKPPMDQPVEEGTTNPADVEQPTLPGAESDSEARIFRGMLSERQARTQHIEKPNRFRLAGYKRGARHSSIARRPNQDQDNNRTVKWIGAPVADSHARL